MMQRYQLKTPAYSAVQFHGFECMEDVMNILGHHTAFTIQRDEDGALTLTTASAPDTKTISVSEGNYIVRDPDGALHVMSHAEFRSTFQVLA
jgi:hypothetical protein